MTYLPAFLPTYQSWQAQSVESRTKNRPQRGQTSSKEVPARPHFTCFFTFRVSKCALACNLKCGWVKYRPRYLTAAGRLVGSKSDENHDEMYGPKGVQKRVRNNPRNRKSPVKQANRAQRFGQKGCKNGPQKRNQNSAQKWDSKSHPSAQMTSSSILQFTSISTTSSILYSTSISS